MDYKSRETTLGAAQRNSARVNIYLAAELVSENAHIPVTIRNLSTTGAQIQSRVALGEDAAVTLARGSLRANGSLIWREGRLGGIEFHNPINLEVWVPGSSNPGQTGVDRVIAESRGHVAPAISSIDHGPQPITGLSGRVAEELALLSRKLDALGSDLADDPITCGRHAAKLQDLDLATQVLGHLVRLLNSSRPDEVLQTIGMEDLRRRLERAPLSAPPSG